MKVIRVKQENAQKVLAAISGATLTQAPDYVDQGVGDYLIPGRDGSNPGDYSDFQSTPAVGMVGINLPDGMSGKQANKIIKSL